MPDTLSITGEAAQLLWGSAVAASLGAWSVTGEPGHWRLVAEIAASNPFRIAQRPLTMLTPNGWRWNVDTVDLVQNQLIASLSPREQ